MTSQLRDLLLTIRQHPAFKELLEAMETPEVKPFRLATHEGQYEEWIFRSGRAQQNENWRLFLTELRTGEEFGPKKGKS